MSRKLAEQRRSALVATKRKRTVPTLHEPTKEIVKRECGRPPEQQTTQPASRELLPSELKTESLLVPLDPDVVTFLHLLGNDLHRLSRPLPVITKRRSSIKLSLERDMVEFQLPFKALEIKTLEERPWVRRPPPFGKINRCVYVSTKMPVADFPVHKCTCHEELHKSMTKRTTVMASVRAQKQVLGKKQTGRRLTRHADLEKRQEMETMVYCGEGCYNRMLFVSCSDDTCSAPDPRMCSNRAIKRRTIKSVRIEYILGPGFGLVANETIRSGEFIIEYVGEVIDDEECERRMIRYRDNGEVNFYMMELEKNTVIDAKYRSNESRFINHSCDPNSVTQKCIAVDEEITINYNFSHFGEAAECKCGSTACTGTIGLKRSKLPMFNYRTVGTAKAKKQECEEPPELKRPVHLSSLALLKSSQLDDSWLASYGFKNRRLFLCHETHQPKKVDSDDILDESEGRQSLSSSSPASVCSTTTEEDVSLTPPQLIRSNVMEEKPSKRSWYDRVIAGQHLPEMRALQSFICGGKRDWTADLTRDRSAELAIPSLVKKRGRGRPPKRRGRPKKVAPLLSCATRVSLNTKLICRRLSLPQARARGMRELAAFAKGTSRWNKRIPSSSTIDPDRIHRLIDRVKGTEIFINTDQVQVRMNGRTCSTRLTDKPGELICCDGCPAAFHLNCTNLAIVPPGRMPWFCSECTNPKHPQKASETSKTEFTAGGPTRCSSDSAGRHLRTHAAPQLPSLKRIFRTSAPLIKRRYKKRHKALDRSYRQLEHMPLPVWNESNDSDNEQLEQ
uniref:Histone-lysine N-methyltransferase n=1 Tax=Hyaloperonospora arabidopsidis (strain Emoy2) TaxID=559515 RepID=M4B453_HYAAE